MATAPISRKLNLTRDQLSAFLTDHQQIKQFELLFSVVDTLEPIIGTDFEYQADTAAANANNALAQIRALAQDTAVDDAVLNAKVQQALDAIPRLAQALDLLSTTPRQEIGTIASQNSDNVNITGGLISGLDAPLPVASGGIGVTTAPANEVFAGPTAGADAPPSFRALVEADIPALPYGTGDVVGPASATDNAVARFDATTGKLIQNSGVIIDDNDNVGVNSIEFDITPATLPTAQGTLHWDNADNAQTLSLVMKGGNAIMQIGEEQYYRVKCSAAITEGQSVMLTGAVGASGGLTAAPASGLNKATAYLFLGVATESGALNDWIYITSVGVVRGINTTGGAESWVDGQLLYYNPAVAGGLTSIEPLAPAAKIHIASVLLAASSNGSIFIRPRIGIQLDDLNDVQSVSASTSDVLQYTAGGFWQHSPPSSLTGVGSVANSVTFNNGGAGEASGTTFNGSVARTISHNTIGAQGVAPPVTKTADFTVANGDIWHINNKSGSTCVVTLPAAASWSGRTLTFKNMQAQLLNSASSNVAPIDSVTAGTAILLNVVGNWASMVSDGTNWIIMQQAPNNILLLE